MTKNRMMSTRRKILNFIFDVWSLKPSGKRLILDELLGRFDKQSIAVDLFNKVFPEIRSIIVKYEREDTVPFSGEILSENVDLDADEEVRKQFKRLNDESVLPMAVDNGKETLDGDPDDSDTGGDSLYHRCMRRLKQPTEKELAIHRAVYEIGKNEVEKLNYHGDPVVNHEPDRILLAVRTRKTPWDAPTEWRAPTPDELRDVEDFFNQVDGDDGEEKP